MVVVAYTMAALWMLIAMYFSIIFGLKFPSAQSRSWVMAFGISLIQDMVVQQSIRVAAKTTISLVVMPRIAAFLAGRMPKKLYSASPSSPTGGMIGKP
jgi:hypothetical protein